MSRRTGPTIALAGQSQQQRLVGILAVVSVERHVESSSLIPRKPAASHIGAPFCISHVAAVWRSVCGVMLPSSVESCARQTGRNAVLTDATGLPCHSTKCCSAMPRRP